MTLLRALTSLLFVAGWMAIPFLRPMVQNTVPHAEAAQHPLIHTSYAQLPITFEANHGQADSHVKFLSRGAGHSLFLTSTEAVLASNDAGTVRMNLVGGNKTPEMAGLDELPGKANYFIGKDPKEWRTDITTYAKVKYEDVYPGVDLVYYGNQQQLEYDFIVAPGASPDVITMGFDGANRLEVDNKGDLLLRQERGSLRQRRPFVYQEIDGKRQEVEGRYRVLSSALVGFELGAYDKRSPLVIDPVLIYSTYFGGGGDDRIPVITVDAAGQAFIAGQTNSLNFPVLDSAQASNGGGPLDVFVAKLNATGTAVLFSTYVGGGGEEFIGSIAVDSNGNAYVNGRTSSSNFPTMNAFQPRYGGGQSDAFVVKLDATGSALVYSTYLGGNAGVDQCADIKVDASGNAYITGSTSSTNFPLVNPLQPTLHGGGDAFAAKLNPEGSALIYSTYLGGDGGEFGLNIAVDGEGSAYVYGQTNSLNFPTAIPIQPTNGGLFDVFVSKLSPSGTSLVYSTYLGGSGRDLARSMAMDAEGNVSITGFAGSNTFPTVNALQPVYGGGEFDAFVAKFNASGTALIFSTFLGGNGRDAGEGLAVDSNGNIYVGGFTSSPNFPTTNALQETYGGPPGGGAIGGDGFVAKLKSDGSALIYSTYLGGSGEEEIVYLAVDAAGNAYVCGQTTSTDYPTMDPIQPANAGLADVFIARISDFSQAYSLAAGGGVSSLVSGSSTLNVGYARMQPAAGTITPSGVAIFGSRQNGVLVSEAGVPASPRVTSGRIYVEIGGPVNTGVAVANPNNQEATATFFFTDEAGLNSPERTFTIPANGQIARFLNEPPFDAGPSLRGTLTFNVNVPVGVTALRGLTNERAEFLVTTLPVVELSSATSDNTVIPHFADGGGWTTTVLLVNSTDAPETGSIQFFGQGTASEAAQPVSVRVDNQESSTFPYTIPPRSSARLQTAGTTATTRAGSVRVTRSSSGRTPSALAVFSFRRAGVTVSEAGVPALPPGAAFRMYVAAAGDFSQAAAGSLQSGLAIANTASSAAPVTVELMDFSGATTGLTSSLTIPAQGQVALFLNQFPGFDAIRLPFEGTLRVSTTSTAGISIVALRGRYNERTDFLITTTPPVSETNPAPGGEMIFPHWASGGGFTTQFILFSPVPSQKPRGMLRLYSQTGKPQ